ncbi:site-2 protease family protein [Rubellimicrobium roseum]|uniref:Zinc metalloprotease n=1 Tax=Rubellimicrobium roseum TaxID=687525 RepID=A0A5C4N9Q7_9RHOB|nr:site-2 protease family protein [Rubellimicrobium roseum]TNC64000.1 site-2 protease family protein [Rubellimicrobium roseum]
MTWSFPIARFLGSEVRIHVTFLLLLVWIGVARYLEGGAAAAVEGLVLILAIFACVLAHEFGHALAARRYGIRTPDITLLPIGGVARLERMPENPREEIVVALAGPAVNVVIAALLILLLGARLDLESLQALDNPAASLLAQLASLNLFLVLFNLIPAFPMDGGRVLRALLALRRGPVEATNIAARIGQGLAFVFGFLGLMGNPMLLFIAIFVYAAASAEAQATGLADVTRRLGVRDAMITQFETLHPQATVEDAVECLLRTTQHEFPVVDGGGALHGVLTRNAIIKALRETGAATPVLDVMERDVPVVTLHGRLDAAVLHLQDGGRPVVAVADATGRLVGYITSENLGELMMIRQAQCGPQSGRGGPLLPQ